MEMGFLLVTDRLRRGGGLYVAAGFLHDGEIRTFRLRLECAVIGGVHLAGGRNLLGTAMAEMISVLGGGERRNSSSSKRKSGEGEREETIKKIIIIGIQKRYT